MDRAAINAAKYSMMEDDAESRRAQEEAEKHNRQGHGEAQQQEKKDWLAVPKETLEREASEPPAELPDPKKEAKRRQIAYSGLYCAFAGERAKNMAAIQELRGNLRMGGAVDMSDLKDYTDWVREAERNMKRIKALVKGLLPCKNPLVRSVAACGVPTQYSGSTGYENFTCAEEYKAGYSDYVADEF
jgi:hypothetical protein